MNETKLHKESVVFKVIEYIVCVFFSFLSIAPFFVMFINATRSTSEIQQHAISLISEHPFINLAKEMEQRRKAGDSDMEAFITDQLQKEFRRMDDLYQTLRHIEENDIFISG